MKTPRQPAATALYPHLVGAAWSTLAEPLQRFHAGTETVKAVGVFTIRHGTQPGARLLAAGLRLPMAGTAVPLRLVITPHRHGERWQRMFAERGLSSEQHAGPGGVLVERFSLFDVWFHVMVVDHALCFRQARAALRLGPLHVLLPRWLAPQVEAREWVLPGQTRVQVEVNVRLPRAGLILAYAGWVVTEEG
jgi:hypothetical protein